MTEQPAVVQASSAVEEGIFGAQLDNHITAPCGEGTGGKQQGHPAVSLLPRFGCRQQPPRQGKRCSFTADATLFNVHLAIGEEVRGLLA